MMLRRVRCVPEFEFSNPIVIALPLTLGNPTPLYFVCRIVTAKQIYTRTYLLARGRLKTRLALPADLSAGAALRGALVDFPCIAPKARKSPPFVGAGESYSDVILALARG